jgi:peptidoglycan/LPS O-acetylase OafA/YrhL
MHRITVQQTSEWEYRPHLDGLRALAVLGVVGFHFQAGRIRGGALGVVVFFVLSGWLITGLLVAEREATGRIDVKAFYLRRALRLYPALIVAVTVICGTAVLMGVTRGVWLAAGTTLVYANDFTKALGGTPSRWLDPTWSLGVEEQFYLVWPLVLIWLLRRGATRRKCGLWCMAVAGAAGMLEIPVRHLAGFEAAYFLPAGSLLPLLAGAGTALIGLRLGRTVAIVSTVVLVAAFVFGPDPYGTAYFEGWHQLASVCSALLIAGLVGSSGLGVLRSQPMVWLGRRSYAVYLYHQAVYVALVESTSLPGSMVTAVGVTLSIGLAAASYRYVETPFLRRKARLARVRGEATATVALATP